MPQGDYQMLRIKVIQLEITDRESRDERFNRVEAILDNLTGESDRPGIIVLPEIWATGFFNFDRYRQESEPLEGETYLRLAPRAEKLGCYLVAGSIIEKDGNSYYNTTLLIGPDGTLCGSYRKIHLFGYQSKESKILTAGSEIYLLKTKYGHWGFSTCYDLRFPELYRKMNEDGVDTFFVVAAWPLARLEHWLLLNRTRALENLSFLVACNCAGSLGGHFFGGNSMVVDPWGEILARTGTKEELLDIEIDSQRAAGIRKEFPALQDRRIR
jgi:predicted amidohydrolase